jgi:hypothetical protein
MLVVQYQLRRYLLGTCTKTRKNACTEHGTRERRINHDITTANFCSSRIPYARVPIDWI